MDEAKDKLRQELEFFIQTAEEMGTLSDVLRDCGFRKVPRKPTDPQGVIIDGTPGRSYEDWLEVQVPSAWRMSSHGDARPG